MISRVIVVGVIEKDGKILLGKKKDDQGPYPNTWHIPGGGVRLDKETLEEGIRREIKEECNIEIKDIQKINFDEDYENNKHGEKTHYVFLSFRAQYDSGELRADDDLDHLEWVSTETLSKLNLNEPSKKLFRYINIIL